MLIDDMSQLSVGPQHDMRVEMDPHQDEDTNTPTNNLDDVFGSNSDSEDSHPHNPNFHRNNDPTDIPRLRSIHVTAGYREGLSSAKESSVQAGFDEGFALGAEMGMAAGWCLGVIRCVERRVGRGRRGVGGGSVSRLRLLSVGERSSAQVGVEVETSSPAQHVTQVVSSSQDTSSETENSISVLARLAERELSMQSLFSGEYIDTDGIWKYALQDGRGGQADESEGEVSFREVALAHPLIGKWMGVAREVMGMLLEDRQLATI